MKKWFSWHWRLGNEGQWFLKYGKQMRWAFCLPQIIALREFPHHVAEMKTQGESGGLWVQKMEFIVQRGQSG